MKEKWSPDVTGVDIVVIVDSAYFSFDGVASVFVVVVDVQIRDGSEQDAEFVEGKDVDESVLGLIFDSGADGSREAAETVRRQPVKFTIGVETKVRVRFFDPFGP